MANRAYLISTRLPTGNFHELTRLGDTDPLLFDIIEEAAYRIPLHWMGCFRAADVREYSVPDGTGGAWEYTAPWVSVAQARANLRAAWPLIEQVVDDPVVAGAYRRYARILLRSLHRPYLAMYVAEVVDGNDAGLLEALGGTPEALSGLTDFANFESDSLPFNFEEWLEDGAEGEAEEVDGMDVTASASPIPTVDRPGVEPRWEKGWKSHRTQALRWKDRMGKDAALALEFFFRHGEERDRYSYYTDADDEPMDPPRRPWESIDRDLSQHARVRLGELERQAIDGGVFDVDLAVQAFAAGYTSQMIDVYTQTMNRLRFPDYSARGRLIESTFAALGVVLGCRHQAFRLARLQLAESRNQESGQLQPIHRFILTLLADFLGEPPLAGPTRGDREPLLEQLAGRWRDHDLAALVPLCLAACDIHTRRTVRSGSKIHEFLLGDWHRVPVEMLLLFRLRGWLGLANPELDHPLMATPLGQLPSPTEFVPDDLVSRIRAAIAADGYDEALIFAGAYSGPDRDAVIRRDRAEALEQPSIVTKTAPRSNPMTKPGKIKRQGVRSLWSEDWHLTANSFAPDAIEQADDLRFIAAYAEKGMTGKPKAARPPLRPWERGLSERLARYADAQLFELEKRGMRGEPFAVAPAANAFVAKYLEQLIAMHSLHFKYLRFRDEPKGDMYFTDIPFTALGMILGFDDEAARLLRLQLLMARRFCYAYHKGNYYPVFTFMLRLLADYLDAGPWIVESNETAGPIYNGLMDSWRVAEAEVLTPLCLAACDYHTWETRREGFGTTEEFCNGRWTRTPIEILLLFDLRRRLGLANPVLDHPIMQSPLAIPPTGSRPPIDGLLQRLHGRLREDGFDEQAIFELLHETPATAAHRFS